MSRYKNSLSPAQATIFGIPEDLAKFAEISDRQTLDDGTQVIIVRTIPDWKDLYVKEKIQQLNPNGVATPDQIARLIKQRCPLDSFDGGIVYHVLDSSFLSNSKSSSASSEVSGNTDPQVKVEGAGAPGRNDGAEAKRSAIVMIRKTYDYPNDETIPASLVDGFFEDNVCEDLHLWVEGTMVAVFTVRGKTFYSTRSKIDCSNSKAFQENQCPTILKMFEEACQNHGIQVKDFAEEGFCHVFLLRHPWNQISKTGLEKACLIHHASFNFSKNYVSVDKKFESIPELEYLSINEAKVAIKSGKIVVSNGGKFPNTKFMLPETASLYDALRNATISPVLEYYRTMSSNKQLAQRLFETLNDFARKKIEDYLNDERKKIDETVEYLDFRVQLRVKDAEKHAKQKADERVANAIRHVTVSYATAREEALSRGKKRKEFFWGGNSALAEQLTRKKCLLDYILKLKEEHGEDFYCLLRDCMTYSKRERYRERKTLEKETKEQVSESVSQETKNWEN